MWICLFGPITNVGNIFILLGKTITKKENYMYLTTSVLRHFQTMYSLHSGWKCHQRALALSFLLDFNLQADGVPTDSWLSTQEETNCTIIVSLRGNTDGGDDVPEEAGLFMLTHASRCLSCQEHTM